MDIYDFPRVPEGERCQPNKRQYVACRVLPVAMACWLNGESIGSANLAEKSGFHSKSIGDAAGHAEKGMKLHRDARKLFAACYENAVLGVQYLRQHGRKQLETLHSDLGYETPEALKAAIKALPRFSSADGGAQD
jgi:hypothetical protein